MTPRARLRSVRDRIVSAYDSLDELTNADLEGLGLAHRVTVTDALVHVRRLLAALARSIEVEADREAPAEDTSDAR